MNWKQLLLGEPEGLVRTLIVGLLAYPALIVLLRISGKRTLSKFNAFDFVVTIAIGSTLASVLVSQQVPLAQGLVAFAVLLALQYGISWLSIRSPRARDLVRSEPTLLLYRGAFLEAALRRERVTRNEVLAQAREQGIASLDDVEAAVLEGDGNISLVRRPATGEPSALTGIHGYPSRDAGPPSA